MTEPSSNKPYSSWTSVQLRKLSSKGIKHLIEYIERLSTVTESTPQAELLSEIELLKRSAVRNNPLTRTTNRGDLESYLLIVSDLAKQGWRFRYKTTLEYQKLLPTATGDKTLSASLKQESALAARYNHLLKPSIRDRVQKLERARLFNGQSVSIFSLMRDGRDLSQAIKDWAMTPSSDIRTVTDPYIQAVNPNEKCDRTGLNLMDIWWYFRQTWGIPHESTAGRSLPFLIRDRATPSHTVVGIAALSSAVAQHSVRDRFIGWDADQVLSHLRDNSSGRLCRWVNNRLNEEIKLVYKDDFIKSKLLNTQSVKRPTNEVIKELKALAAREKELHHQSLSQTRIKNPSTNLLDKSTWLHEATTHLFKSKRALLLSQLLDCRLVLEQFALGRNTTSALKAAVETKAGRKAIARIIRLQKERTVGTAIAELSVCGSIQPYSALLGGKLVSLMMTSPEVLSTYKKRYGGHVNIIASSMAAKVIQKPADLAYLSTTSLYGRPNQYTRVSVPINTLGEPSRGGSIKYQYLGKTRGTGSLHFSTATIESFKSAQLARGEAIKVTGQFGEGGSEKLRYLRDRLTYLGFDSNDVLEHGVPRSYYGIKLIDNTRNFLLGIDKTPRYLIPRKRTKTSTSRIFDWWVERWLKRYLCRPDVDQIFDKLEQHTLIMPVKHGARVMLPRSDIEQNQLFPELEFDESSADNSHA